MSPPSCSGRSPVVAHQPDAQRGLEGAFWPFPLKPLSLLCRTDWSDPAQPSFFSEVAPLINSPHHVSTSPFLLDASQLETGKMSAGKCVFLSWGELNGKENHSEYRP